MDDEVREGITSKRVKGRRSPVVSFPLLKLPFLTWSSMSGDRITTINGKNTRTERGGGGPDQSKTFWSRSSSGCPHACTRVSCTFVRDAKLYVVRGTYELALKLCVDIKTLHLSLSLSGRVIGRTINFT